jgi:hypothetical protein
MNAAKMLFALELFRPFACPSFVFDRPSYRFDVSLKFDEIFNRNCRWAGLIFNRQGLHAPVQLADSALKIMQILVQHHAFSVCLFLSWDEYAAIPLSPEGVASLVPPPAGRRLLRVFL